MDAREPRVRRRGFFLHSSDGGEPDTGEHENPEGFIVRVRFPGNPVPRKMVGAARRRPAAAGRHRTDTGSDGGNARDQIRERDWQPSTVTLAPLIQLARGETRNATTAPTSSGRPNRPNGSSRCTNSAIPVGIVLHAAVPRSPRKPNRPRRHAVDADVVVRQLLRHRLRQADFRGLDGVVRHPAARFAAPDRRNHHDRAAAARAACAARPAGRPEWRETASDRRLPATRRRWCRRCRRPSPGRRC